MFAARRRVVGRSGEDTTAGAGKGAWLACAGGGARFAAPARVRQPAGCDCIARQRAGDFRVVLRAVDLRAVFLPVARRVVFFVALRVLFRALFLAGDLRVDFRAAFFVLFFAACLVPFRAVLFLVAFFAVFFAHKQHGNIRRQQISCCHEF